MTVSKLCFNINEYVFGDRDMRILILKYVDGLTYNEIADLRNDKDLPLFNVDVRQIRRICKKYENRIFKE